MVKKSKGKGKTKGSGSALARMEKWKLGAIVGGVWGFLSFMFKVESVAFTLSDFYIGAIRFQLLPIELTTIIAKLLLLPSGLWWGVYEGCQDYGCLPVIPLSIMLGVAIGASIGYLVDMLRGE